jgi:putative chitinase
VELKSQALITAPTAPDDWSQVIRQGCPNANATIASQLGAAMAHEFARGRIGTPLRQAHFLAQAAEETDQFSTLTEEGSTAYFRRYDYRRDLGNVFPGDGAKFRGRGVFMDTGRANYQLQSTRRGVDLIKHPELAARGDIALANAIDGWTAHSLNSLADADNVVAITRKINGGTNGLSVRKMFLARFKHILGHTVHPAGLVALPLPVPSDQTQAHQQRLLDRGYAIAPDGEVTSQTVAAVSAFQYDHELPITGDVDDDTAEALYGSDDPRPIDDDRAHGTPEDSRILAGAGHLQLGGVITAASGAAAVASDSLSKVQALFEPLQALQAFMTAHPIGLLVAGGLAVSLLAYKIARDRIADHRSWKTP